MTDETPTLNGHGGTHAVTAAARARRRHDVHAVRRARVPALRRRGRRQGRRRRRRARADAPGRRAARADRGVRRRGARRSSRAHRASPSSPPGPASPTSSAAITTAHFNGSPLVVLGGRSPDNRWGTGALQELDQPPLLAPVTKHAATVHATAEVGTAVSDAFTTARLAAPRPGVPRRPDGRAVLLRRRARGRRRAVVTARRARPRRRRRDRARCSARRSTRCSCSAATSGPAAPRTPRCASSRRSASPSSPTAWAAASCRPATRCSSPGRAAPRSARPTSWSWSARRWTSGSGTASSAARTARRPRRSCTSPTPPARSRAHASARRRTPPATSRLVLDALREGVERAAAAPDVRPAGPSGCAASPRAAAAKDAADLRSDRDPIHPARIYGELLPRLAEDAVVIGDGGDFVSYAGKYVEPARPGGWLDPGPYGCLGTGLGYADRRAGRAARRARSCCCSATAPRASRSWTSTPSCGTTCPVVMVVGNNGIWGLEKHPMQFLYGYDVAAELRPGTRYDEVVTALGGGGETVTDPAQIGPALDRAFACGHPVPRQRPHRPRDRLPAQHDRRLSAVARRAPDGRGTARARGLPRLRAESGLSPKSVEQASAGLHGAWAAVHVVDEASGETVGMGRVLGRRRVVLPHRRHGRAADAPTSRDRGRDPRHAARHDPRPRTCGRVRDAHGRRTGSTAVRPARVRRDRAGHRGHGAGRDLSPRRARLDDERADPRWGRPSRTSARQQRLRSSGSGGRRRRTRRRTSSTRSAGARRPGCPESPMRPMTWPRVTRWPARDEVLGHVAVVELRAADALHHDAQRAVALAALADDPTPPRSRGSAMPRRPIMSMPRCEWSPRSAPQPWPNEVNPGAGQTRPSVTADRASSGWRSCDRGFFLREQQGPGARADVALGRQAVGALERA